MYLSCNLKYTLIITHWETAERWSISGSVRQGNSCHYQSSNWGNGDSIWTYSTQKLEVGFGSNIGPASHHQQDWKVKESKNERTFVLRAINESRQTPGDEGKKARRWKNKNVQMVRSQKDSKSQIQKTVQGQEESRHVSKSPKREKEAKHWKIIPPTGQESKEQEKPDPKTVQAQEEIKQMSNKPKREKKASRWKINHSGGQESKGQEKLDPKDGPGTRRKQSGAVRSKRSPGTREREGKNR